MIRTRQSRIMSWVEVVTQKAVVAAVLMPSGIYFLGLSPFQSVGFTAYSMAVSIALSLFNRRIFDRMPVILRFIRRKFNGKA